MQSKSWYRDYFAECMEYVKMNNVLKDMGSTPTNFYRFMKSDQFDYIMSLEMLERVRQQVLRSLEKIT